MALLPASAALLYRPVAGYADDRGHVLLNLLQSMIKTTKYISSVLSEL
jgi:hypothetical protein